MPHNRTVVRWRSVVLGVGFAAIMSSCSTKRTGDGPFLIPQEQFHHEVARLVVAPTVVSSGLDVPELVLLRTDSLVADRLTAGGYFVIPSTTYADVWAQVTDQAGGFYDPYTGQRDEQRFRTAVDLLTRELGYRFGHDAVAYPEIRATEARIFGRSELNALWGVARWDGVAVSSAFGNDYVNAVSLVVVIDGVDGTQLYECSGGITVTERWDNGANDMVAVLTDDVFGDDEKLARAVDIALEPLGHRPHRIASHPSTLRME